MHLRTVDVQILLQAFEAGRSDRCALRVPCSAVSVQACNIITHVDIVQDEYQDDGGEEPPIQCPNQVSLSSSSSIWQEQLAVIGIGMRTSS